jgi:hypothetical protein
VNTARQPKAPCSQPPITGASAGASPKIMVMSDSRRCASWPGKLSRTMARPTTHPTPADKPCTPRKNSSWGKLWAKVQPIDPSTKIARQPSITGRRPNESDRAPWNSVITAKAAR